MRNFIPIFLNFLSLFTYSFGFKTFGGSETKSLAKLVPSSKALKFNSIYDVVAKVVKKHKNVSKPSIKQILDADLWAREETRKVMSQL